MPSIYRDLMREIRKLKPDLCRASSLGELRTKTVELADVVLRLVGALEQELRQSD